MSDVLPQEQFQKMVSGEGLQVSVKHGMAFTVPWQSHIIAASNTMFNYEDNAGQTSRRVVVFAFEKPLDPMTADMNLDSKIIDQELPNVIAKCLACYFNLIEETKGTSFWAACPAVLREAQEDAMANGNLVYRFLRAGPDENASLTSRCFVRQVQGAVTEWSDFKKVFDAYVRYKHRGMKWVLNVNETGPFTKLNYDVVRISLCRACGGSARVGCCVNYSTANRSKKWLIKNMELVRELINHDSAQLFE
jgi:phage/plasmid-associated DNA primase